MPDTMSGLFAQLASALKAGSDLTEPRKRRQSELDTSTILRKLLEDVESTFTDFGTKGKWRSLREMAQKQERELRQQELLEPYDEVTFEATLLWTIQQGGEEELAILHRIRPSLPHSSPDVLKLMETAEQRIQERLRSLPLPDQVRRMANAYTMGRLGDALQPEHAGTVADEDGVRTWHVKVRQQSTGSLRGVLRICEDTLAVEWAPVKKD